MQLEASDKTANFGVRPHVKKGYYPAKLLSVKPFADKDGKLIDKQYGHMLIFDFAIFDKDKDGKPTNPLQFAPDEGNPKNLVDVTISKFVYHKYKDGKTGELRTAITPKSSITKTLTALGWTFNSEKGVDTNSLVGKWVEVNVNDYPQKIAGSDDTYKASGIQDIGPYEGPEPGETKEVSPSNPKIINKTLDHKDVELASKRASLKEMFDKGQLKKEAYENSLKALTTNGGAS